MLMFDFQIVAVNYPYRSVYIINISVELVYMVFG